MSLSFQISAAISALAGFSGDSFTRFNYILADGNHFKLVVTDSDKGIECRDITEFFQQKAINGTGTFFRCRKDSGFIDFTDGLAELNQQRAVRAV